MAASARARIDTSGSHTDTRHQDTRHQGYAAVSVSVGRDDWSDVLDHVVSHQPVLAEQTSQQAQAGQVKRLVGERKRQFHNGRPLELKNLPDGVTEQDIRAAFPDLDLKSVTVEKSDGRYKPGARLTLDNPEILDDWPKSRENVYVKNKEVSVCVGGSDQWLCVAKLPISFTQIQLTSLVSAYGKVREAFMMVSERTGESKGYGFVKYVSNEAAVQARHLMDKRNIGGFVVECDWLNSTHISFKQLHSKCLYVSNLPENYRDMANFRKIFSTVKNPPYCQIAMKNGVIQNWGLVEFFNSDEAERTQEELNGYCLAGSNMRVHFCIPGVNAINIYMKVVNQPTDNNKKSLMDDAPSSSVYRQLQKLAAQNPIFAQNLETIIQTQISSLQGGSSPTPTDIGPDQDPTPPHGTGGLNHQAQAALMILLTAQRQASSGDPSLLHDPQVVDALQNLVTQDPMRPEAKVDIKAIPGLNLVFNSMGSPPPPPLPYTGPPTPIHSQWGLHKQNGNANKDHRNTPELTTEPTNKSPPPIIANNLNLLSNTKSLNQLLGSLTQTAPSPPPIQTQHIPTKPNPTGLPLQMPPNPPLLPPPHLPMPPGHLQMPPPPRPALLGNSPPLMMIPPPIPTTLAQHQLLQAQLSAAGQLQAAGQLTPSGILTAGPPLHLPPTMYQPLPQLQNPFLVPSIPGMSLTGAPPAGFFLQQISPSLSIPYSMPASLMGHPPPTIVSSSHSPSLSHGLQAPIGTPYMPTLASLQTLINPPLSIGVATPPPNSLKRKLPIPPSPEQSPEGPYIGQHSQGIGGHYQDSYWQKKRARHQY